MYILIQTKSNTFTPLGQISPMAIWFNVMGLLIIIGAMTH